jgi:diguanylate cyclase (GGDEF)-like protein
MKLTLEQLVATLNSVPDPHFVLTESGRYAGVFGGGDSAYYHDGSSLVGRFLYDVMPNDKADWIMEQIALALREGHLRTVEYGLSNSDIKGQNNKPGPSGEIWFEGRIQPLPFDIEGERAVVWTARNITRRYQLEAKLRRMSEVDELTGVYNRRKLLEELAEKFREFRRYAYPTAMLMLDIDHFKRVNDRYGHLVGDEVLRLTTEVCLQQLRDVDLFSRFGGEEFVALLPHTSIEEARSTAERLREAVEMHQISHSGNDIHISVSIGVSALIESDNSYESVIKRIDNALYEAKRTGRNRVFVATDAG